MKASDIRNTFLNFFQDRGHTLVRPSNVIMPDDDPTLLFTNAGMNQFKAALLGRETRSYKRATSCQPCMRVGGKHNDLDAVGKDGRHHTWFEMLGNWSFGDYYKEDAIAWAWDLVKDKFQLDTSLIHASVYKDDDESAAIWKKVAGLPDDRIHRLGDVEKGDEENFWSMGPTGPCGPCTELYIDQGLSFGHDVVGGPSDRFLEFWNLVFMEFDRAEDGSVKPLPMRSVDTGMGLERVAAILQGKTNVFHTDLFMPIIHEICEKTGRDFTGDDASAMCVVADHIRGLSFTLNDGGVFDRVGRGYVLRRILRRAVLHGDQIGIKEPWLYTLVPTVVTTTGAYDLPPERMAIIQETIRDEEAKFFRTLDRGLVYFTKVADELQGRKEKVISGPAAFQLYDTYGFPVDLTRILAEKRCMEVDDIGFDQELAQQRARSKSVQEFYDAGGWISLAEGNGDGFAGYDLATLDVRVLRYRERADGGVDLILDRTPLYIEGGGEQADYGTITGGSLAIQIDEVRRIDVGVVHGGRLIRGVLEDLANKPLLTAMVDYGRRQAKAAHHTATHLLHAALHEIVDPGARQKGSLVAPDRLRFDFVSSRALSPEELQLIEERVNRWILDDLDVVIQLDVPHAEAVAGGAMAFFADNYGETVRVVTVPKVGQELCGGNHVRRTSQIGSFLIMSEESVGSGIRRIEAVTHMAAVQRVRELRDVLAAAATVLNISPEQLPTRAAQLIEEVKKLTRDKEQLSRAALTGKGADALLDGAESVDGVLIQVKLLPDTDAGLLKQALDNLRVQHANGVFIMISEGDGRGSILIGCGVEAVKRGLKAGDLAKVIASRLGSGGGGRPDFAQTGFKGIEAAKVVVIANETVRAAVGG
ncbi:MAG: alanine--tRNA ligase [Rhodospirillaceae bacterium]